MSLSEQLSIQVERNLDEITSLPVVADAHLDTWFVDEREERVVVIKLIDGIESVPPAVSRNIADADLNIELIETYPNHIKVVCQ